jgi:hypothetical protein
MIYASSIHCAHAQLRIITLTARCACANKDYNSYCTVRMRNLLDIKVRQTVDYTNISFGLGTYMKTLFINHIIPFILWRHETERERDWKDRWRLDSKRKSRGELRYTLFSEEGKRALFCYKVPRLRSLVLLVGVMWKWRRYGNRGWLQTDSGILDFWLFYR